MLEPVSTLFISEQLLLITMLTSLVQKVVIDQESFSRLINTFTRGAYRSMSKIDFKALDEGSINPIGIYGSQSEIVRFLQRLGAVREEM